MQPKARIQRKEQKWNVPVKKPLRMNIRFANNNDLPQIIELCKEHAEYERAEYEQKNKAELLSEFIFGQNPSLKCLIVEQDNSIIGYATYMKQFSTWDSKFYIYMDCLFLKEKSGEKFFGEFFKSKLTFPLISLSEKK